MNFSTLLKNILSKIHWIISVTLVVAIICTVYFYRVPFIYQSSASFFIDDNDESHGLKFSGDPNSLILAQSSSGDRLFHLGKSTEMMDHLIDKFNLYNHYNIDRNSPMHYETINAVLQGRITIVPDPFHSINIIVTDYDKNMAADIANEIFCKLDVMNKEFIVSNIEKKLKIYDQLLSGSKKQSFEQSEELRKLIDKCNLLLLNKDTVKDRNYLISDLKVNISMMSSQLSSVNNDMLKSIRAYEIATASLQAENLPNLRLIDLALPDLRTPLSHAISWTIMLSLFAALGTFCIIGILYENARYVEKLFKQTVLQKSGIKNI